MAAPRWRPATRRSARDRKSTRLNSSHGSISYAVFCLKKKKMARAAARADSRDLRHLAAVFGRLPLASRTDAVAISDLHLDKEVLRASLAAFFFNDTATTEIYTLSLHDALPI